MSAKRAADGDWQEHTLRMPPEAGREPPAAVQPPPPAQAPAGPRRGAADSVAAAPATPAAVLEPAEVSQPRPQAAPPATPAPEPPAQDVVIPKLTTPGGHEPAQPEDPEDEPPDGPEDEPPDGPEDEPPDGPDDEPEGGLGRMPGIAATLLLAIGVALGIGGLFWIGVLPTRMLVAAIVADVALASIAGYFLVTGVLPQKKARFGVSLGCALALVAANLFVGKVAWDYNSFTGYVQEGGMATVKYDIIALDGGPADLAALAGQTVSLNANDPYVAEVKAGASKLVSVEFVDDSNNSAAIDSLISGDVPGSVIDDNYLQLIEETDEETYAGLVVLGSFELDVVQPAPDPAPGATPSGRQAGDPFVLYISGVDTYGSISTKARSDVNILLVANPQTGKVLLVSTPRDFYVQLHGTTGLKDKLTHAGIYGIDVSVGTMQDLYEVTVDYNLRVNFNSLIDVVNALGGIDVVSDYEFTATHGGYHFTKGVNHMNGQQALGFVRQRYNLPGGDRARGQNQQRVIEAIIKKLSQPSVLIRYNTILDSLRGAIQTSMPQEEISTLARNQLDKGTDWQITSMSANGSDGSEYTYSYSRQKLYVMIPDQSTVDAAKQAIQDVLAGR